MDTVAKIMIDACSLYDGEQAHIFNARSFAVALAKHHNVRTCMADRYADTVLESRRDIIKLEEHYKLKWWRRLFNTTRCMGCHRLVPVENGTRKWGCYCGRCTSEFGCTK